MSIETKKRIVFVWLVLFAAWPLCHHALVRRFEINPWKFFGWSMYCVPVGRISVHLFPVEGGGPAPRSWAAGQPAEVTEAMSDFLNDRRVWGLLLKPDQLSEVIFESAPDLQGYRITVLETVLDTDTAHLVSRDHDYVYFRQ